MENYYKYLFRKLDLEELERIIQVRQDLLKLHLEQVQQIPVTEQILENRENPTEQERQVLENMKRTKYWTGRNIIMIDKYIINEIRYLYLNKAILTLLDFEKHQMYLHQEQGILQGPLYRYYQHLIDQLGLTERIRETYEV